jgi:type II secretion system protein N
MLAINRQTLLLWSGYTVFFLFCFTLFGYLTFPYDRVRDVLVSKVAASSAPGTKLSIGELGPHWLTGVTLTAVKLERKGAAAGDPPNQVVIDKLKVRASPFSLLFGNVGVHFDALVGKGEIDGSYDAKKDGPARTQAQLDNVDLSKLGLAGWLGLPIEGLASGTLDVMLSDKAAETEGDVDLRIEGLKLGDGKAKVKIPGMGGLTLEKVDAGTLSLKVKIKEAVATIERLEAKGKDVELSGSGSVRLLRPIDQSRADITLGVKVEDAYTQRNARTKAMFDLIGASPIVSSAKGADGKLRFTLTGALSSLRSAPAGPGAGLPSARTHRAKAR